MNLLTTVLLLLVALLPGNLVSDNLLTRLHVAPQIQADSPKTEAYQPVAVPMKIGGGEPNITASSGLAIDVTTGQTLFERDADQKRPIASITKLVTALVILSRHSEDQVVTIPTLPSYGPDDEVVGLQAGMQMTIGDLLKALLINSGNDAADALAQIDSGSQPAFAKTMNQLMQDWQIKDASFSNPSGLSDAGNGASARALATLGQLALRNPLIEQTVRTQAAVINDRNGHSISLKTTDQLLSDGHFQGIKTGYTPAAGQCFVGLTTIQGHRVITVVLNSPDRFGETTSLTSWIDHTYQWQ